ncbi:MAG: DUF362 domain-containing protein [Candidatus Omnitrophica bacterium]|nr:DUF362 domain-containing protein [Candidatus Omnitrophota bacterium]MDD5351906.1 DUF362 domain-containing protein [Candidatus Omnitrophota bacterium]MDD5550732.1 DUF362 domain-containing protein [Candidatus Omnitrophota bacterium]
MPSEVYFKSVSDEASRNIALSKILERLPVFQKNSIVAIKITVGDENSRLHINPKLVAMVVEKVKSQSAKPFIFDTNVIYKGKRMNAVDHLNLAYEKGFSPKDIGAPFIIADGLSGLDGREFQVDYKHIKKVKIPSFVGVVDNLIVLSHITGHILSSYAGAIKNVGMGMSCRSGKQIQHSSVKPKIISKKCVMCGACINICPVNAISQKEEKAFIDSKVCVGCGECLCACLYDAVAVNWKEDIDVFCERMAEYAFVILSKFKNKFFINFAFDITKECDCIATANEPKICQDLGILASGDILAVEKATVDLLNKNEDIFLKAQKSNSYLGQLNYAGKISLGNLEYELIQL